MIPDPSQAGSQIRTSGGLDDSQIPGGGIMPVVPPVVHDSKPNIQVSLSQGPPQTQKTREECEDCQ